MHRIGSSQCLHLGKTCEWRLRQRFKYPGSVFLLLDISRQKVAFWCQAHRGGAIVCNTRPIRESHPECADQPIKSAHQIPQFLTCILGPACALSREFGGQIDSQNVLINLRCHGCLLLCTG